MTSKIETIIMWPEYGDALFWHKGKGCCGSSRNLVTYSREYVDLSKINELQEWYARFDDDKNPAYEWSLEAYRTWKDEGVKYAMAVREVLPDHIDLQYDDDGGEHYTLLPRKNRIIPSKPLTSDHRLIEEVAKQMQGNRNEPYREDVIAFVRYLCSACKYEELLETAHCQWNFKEKMLKVSWMFKSLNCTLFLQLNAEGNDIYAGYSINEGDEMDDDDQPVIIEDSSTGWFETVAEIGISAFVELLSWHILDRGLH